MSMTLSGTALTFNDGTQQSTLAPRAWVNFNGEDPFVANPTSVPIRAQSNVASITKNSTGDFTINFTTAMPDDKYATVYGGQFDNTGGAAFAVFGLARVAGARSEEHTSELQSH